MIRVRVGDGDRYVEVECENILKVDEVLRRVLKMLDDMGIKFNVLKVHS